MINILANHLKQHFLFRNKVKNAIVKLESFKKEINNKLASVNKGNKNIIKKQEKLPQAAALDTTISRQHSSCDSNS